MTDRPRRPQHGMKRSKQASKPETRLHASWAGAEDGCDGAMPCPLQAEWRRPRLRRPAPRTAPARSGWMESIDFAKRAPRTPCFPLVSPRTSKRTPETRPLEDAPPDVRRGCSPLHVMSCFVYGSLLSAEVVQALLGRLPATQPATLRGHSRLAIRGRSYPAAVRSRAGEESSIEGCLLLELSPAEWRLCVPSPCSAVETHALCLLATQARPV